MVNQDKGGSLSSRHASAGMAFSPGQAVRLQSRPDWGHGVVQSAIGSRVTVMFEHAGKVVIDTKAAALEHLA